MLASEHSHDLRSCSSSLLPFLFCKEQIKISCFDYDRALHSHLRDMSQLLTQYRGLVTSCKSVCCEIRAILSWKQHITCSDREKIEMIKKGESEGGSWRRTTSVVRVTARACKCACVCVHHLSACVTSVLWWSCSQSCHYCQSFEEIVPAHL